MIGIGAVLPALLLAMFSDSIAFLANTSAGIEAVIHFGFAATIATASSFLVLGIVLPVAYSRIDQLLAGRNYKGAAARANIIASSFGAASAAGGAVILLVAVSPIAGAVFLAVALTLTVLLPALYLKLRPSRTAESKALVDSHQSPADSTDLDESHTFDRLASVTRFRYVLIVAVAAITGVAAMFALRLEATFDVKDFFASSSDFTVSLDKLDQHVGARSGEPATILIEGDFSDLVALASIQAVYDNLDGNPNVGRDSQGVVSINEPNILQIIRDITAAPAGRAGVEELTGVAISPEAPYGFPVNSEQVTAVLDYAVQAGVPSLDGELAYTPLDVQSVLVHNPHGQSLDLTQVTVLPARHKGAIKRCPRQRFNQRRPRVSGQLGRDHRLRPDRFTFHPAGTIGSDHRVAPDVDSDSCHSGVCPAPDRVPVDPVRYRHNHPYRPRRRLALRNHAYQRVCAELRDGHHRCSINRSRNRFLDPSDATFQGRAAPCRIEARGDDDGIAWHRCGARRLCRVQCGRLCDHGIRADAAVLQLRISDIHHGLPCRAGGVGGAAFVAADRDSRGPQETDFRTFD